MSKKLIISQIRFKDKPCLATAIFDEEVNRIIELQISSKDKENILGNIYVGKVQKVATHLNAAFVDIKPNFSCYYPLNKNKMPYITSIPKRDAIRAGDELLVQVSTEAIKGKIPTVTAHLNFSGQYVALTIGKSGIGVSNKLDEDSKMRLKELLVPYVTDDASLIVRTNAVSASEEELIKDTKKVIKRWESVRHLGKTRTCYSLIDEAILDCIVILKGIKRSELTEIITDDKDTHDYLQDYINDNQVNCATNLRYYEDKLLSLSKLYSVESTLENALQEKVWLKSGGFLIIQQTAAFVAIDVNSGKFQSKKDANQTYQRVNTEAALEIAIQLRLRNLSGIILIDFINMALENDQEQLLENLQRYLRRDNVKAVVIDITPLHIVEVTRKKAKKSLVEQIADI